MSQELYSVENVAEQLGLHVRTVRRYIREGRLKAVRLGKSYRIVRSDLDAFVGPASAPQSNRSLIEASSIVEIEGLDREASIRMTNIVLAAANARPSADEPLRVETLYDEGRARLKVIMIGGLRVTADLMKLIAVWSETRR